jgi:hypothetical protein
VHPRYDFLVALAGQVSYGLTPGEGEEERMREALKTIGWLVRDAHGDDQITQAILDEIMHLAEQTRMERSPDGRSWHAIPRSRS